MLTPKAYEGKEPYIFVSYAHKDSEKVIPIIAALQDRGFRVWYDEGLEVGSSWGKMLAEYLYSCTCTICFISPNFLNSQNCHDEIYSAKQYDKSPLIIYLEDFVPDREFQFSYGRFHALKYTDFSNLDHFMDKLASTKILLTCKAEKAAPAPAAAPAPKPAPQPVAPPKPAPQPVAPPKPATPEELYQQGKALYDSKIYSKAIPFFQQSAQQGHADAQYLLAHCYEYGKGVRANSDEFKKWFRAAANQGHVDAQYRCARVVATTDRETAEWMQKAADQGHSEAQYWIGVRHEEGRGIPKSLKDAYRWFQKAANQGHQQAQEKVAYYATEVRLLDITPKECLERGKQHFKNQEYAKAFDYFHSGATRNEAECQHLLGILYENGWGCEKSSERAYVLHCKAADQGHEEALFWLAEYYQKHDDAKAAFEYYLKLAEKGNAAAQYEVARSYMGGTGIDANTQTAVSWCEKAAKQNHGPAVKILPQWHELLEEEQMTPQQLYEKALRLLRDNAFQDAKSLLYQATQKDHGPSALRLAELHDTGAVDENGNVVIKRDPRVASVYYTSAARCGFPFAKEFADSASQEYAETPRDGLDIWAKPKYKTAQEWYNRRNDNPKYMLFAARAGHAEAQAELAHLNHPERTDDDRSHYWRKKVAARGNADAMFVLGYRHYKHEEYDNAVAWFRKAADAGSYEGKHYLARCYAEGNGVPMDCVKAIELHLEIPETKRCYAYCSDGDLFGMTPDSGLVKTFADWYIAQLRNPQKYSKAHILQTIATAAEEISYTYTWRFAEALHKRGLFEPALAVYQNCDLSSYGMDPTRQLAICYHFGHGVKQDYTEAAKLYEKDAKSPSLATLLSCIALHEFYKKGLGVKKSWFAAQKWDPSRRASPKEIAQYSAKLNEYAQIKEFKL